MKRFLALAFALVFAVVAHAAPGKGTGLSSPVMTNFNARDFLVTLAAGTAPTNIIQLKWGIPNPPAPDVPGNIIYFSGGTNLWTNLGGILQPKNLTLPVMITNQLQFGPGTTNVVYRKSGSDYFTFTSGVSQAGIELRNKTDRSVTMGVNNTYGSLETDRSQLLLTASGGTAQLDGGVKDFSPTTDMNLSLGKMSLAWKDVYTSNLFVRGFVESVTNYSRLHISQSDTNSPVVFDIQTWGSGTNGANGGFSFRTNGVEVLAVTGTGGPSSAANWVAQTNNSSMLPGTAFFGSSARTNWLDQVSITTPMASMWITDNGDPSRMQPYWQVSKDGVWNKMAATFYIDLATNFLHFGGTADNGNTNGPWFSFNAKNDQAYTVLDLGCSENESFFMLDPYTITRPNFWFTVRTNNTSDTILAITNLTTKVLGLKTNGDLSLPGTLSANAAVVTNTVTAANFNGVFNVYDGVNRTGVLYEGGGGSAALQLCRGGAIVWSSSPLDVNPGDTFIRRDDANVVAMRNNTAPQAFKAYNTWSNNGVDYERGVLDWITTPNSFTIGTEMGGTGSSRAVQFRQGGTNVFYIDAATGALLWNDTGTRNIGASGGNKPLNIYASASLNAGTQVVIAGTTNQVIFGSTNTAPVSSAAPTKWISVQVSGETNIYRLPLYE